MMVHLWLVRTMCPNAKGAGRIWNVECWCEQEETDAGARERSLAGLPQNINICITLNEFRFFLNYRMLFVFAWEQQEVTCFTLKKRHWNPNCVWLHCAHHQLLQSVHGPDNGPGCGCTKAPVAQPVRHEWWHECIFLQQPISPTLQPSSSCKLWLTRRWLLRLKLNRVKPWEQCYLVSIIQGLSRPRPPPLSLENLQKGAVPTSCSCFRAAA